MRASVLGAVALVGCVDPLDKAVDPTEQIGEQLSDFSLEDVNSTSETVGSYISPRNYQEMASAWYFGHST